MALDNFRVAGTLSGNSPETVQLPEAASQSFKRGQCVYLVAGAVTVALTTGVVFGVAAEDASGTTGNLVRVWVLNSDTKFHCTSNAAVAQAFVGDNADFVIVSTNHQVDPDGTTNNVFVIVDNPGGVASTDCIVIGGPAAQRVTGT